MKGLRTTSPDALGKETPRALRLSFVQELDQLRLQVELMALKVDDALQRSTAVLLTGDTKLAEDVIAGDDDIDATFVSLTERSYELLVRQSPVASDLRLVVSVLRILGDLERTGDLCLRIVKLAPDQPLLASNQTTFGILRAMSREASGLFRAAIRAWSSQDLRLAMTLEERDDALDRHYAALMQAVLELEGPRSVPLAVQSLSAGRALERIADHSVMIGERLRYMLTGSLRSISKEIGP
ncbi:MAG TPA: phosphate signaling complex protein PhoU [Actinomycetota bacterium]|nr:phosphate signaling complex protein PhoU [Actinomycetota bacterium]